MKKDDKLFILSVIFILFISALSVIRTARLKEINNLGAPTIDIDVVKSQVRSGNLSMVEAQFYKVIEE